MTSAGGPPGSSAAGLAAAGAGQSHSLRERGAKVGGPRTWEAAAPRGRGGGQEAARVGGSRPSSRALPPRARRGNARPHRPARRGGAAAHLGAPRGTRFPAEGEEEPPPVLSAGEEGSPVTGSGGRSEVTPWCLLLP